MFSDCTMHQVVRRASIACAAGLLLSGCPSVPVRLLEARPVPPERLLAFQTNPSPAASTMIVVRDGYSGTIGVGAGCFYALWIDGVLAARFDVAEGAQFLVAPGERALKVGRDPEGRGLCGVGPINWTQRESMFRPNETKVLRIRVNESGADIMRADP